MTRIFPAIRAEAARRQVGFFEVDLRWGITEEQSRAGETLAICLAEIERCRPFSWPAGRALRLGSGRGHGGEEEHHRDGDRSRCAAEPWPWPAAPSSTCATLPGCSPSPPNAARRSCRTTPTTPAGGAEAPHPGERPSRAGELPRPCAARGAGQRRPGGRSRRGVSAGKALDGLDRDLWDHEGFAASRARVFTGRSRIWRCSKLMPRRQPSPLSWPARWARVSPPFLPVGPAAPRELPSRHRDRPVHRRHLSRRGTGRLAEKHPPGAHAAPGPSPRGARARARACGESRAVAGRSRCESEDRTRHRRAGEAAGGAPLPGPRVASLGVPAGCQGPAVRVPRALPPAPSGARVPGA